MTGTQLEVRPAWAERIPDDEWQVYRKVVREARRAGIPFAFGGAFATAVYTGELRNTKDLDLYVLPQDRESMIEVITRAGLQDYYATLAYDRAWIYRGSEGAVIVDVIWAMANLRAYVDSAWLTRGPEVTIRGERLRAIPAENLIWNKLYVVQRERCDWGDVLNLVAARAEAIDWDYLIGRLTEDVPLLAGALSVFGWLDPRRANDIPAPVWRRLGLTRQQGGDSLPQAGNRADLLDSRPWYHSSR